MAHWRCMRGRIRCIHRKYAVSEHAYSSMGMLLQARSWQLQVCAANAVQTWTWGSTFLWCACCNLWCACCTLCIPRIMVAPPCCLQSYRYRRAQAAQRGHVPHALRRPERLGNSLGSSLGFRYRAIHAYGLFRVRDKLQIAQVMQVRYRCSLDSE